MTDLATRYMGIPLRNPVMVAAWPISHNKYKETLG